MTTSDTDLSPGVDPTRPHSARIWNFWLDGKDNYPIDRQVGGKILEDFPQIVESARADRAFLRRAVTHLVVQENVDQFLDIGTGLPTADNTHEIAQRANPAARVVYVDNDPLVMAHAAALLTSTPQGATDYIQADLRDPQTIMASAARTLDLSRPIGITLLGVLNFLVDDHEATHAVQHLTRWAPPGSFLVISHPSTTVDGAGMRAAIDHWHANGGAPITTRTPTEIAGFLGDLELLEPGVVSCTQWRPNPQADPEPEVPHVCGVARKPVNGHLFR